MMPVDEVEMEAEAIRKKRSGESKPNPALAEV